MWVLGIKPGSLERAASAEPSFQRLILTLAYNCLVYSLKLREKTQCSSPFYWATEQEEKT